VKQPLVICTNLGSLILSVIVLWWFRLTILLRFSGYLLLSISSLSSASYDRTSHSDRLVQRSSCERVFCKKKTLSVRRSLISSFHFSDRSREPAKEALLAYLANSKQEATDRLRMLLPFLSFTFPLARPLANTPTARWRLHIWEGSLDRSHLSLTRPTSKNGTLQTKTTKFEEQQEPMIGSLVTGEPICRYPTPENIGRWALGRWGERTRRT